MWAVSLTHGARKQMAPMDGRTQRLAMSGNAWQRLHANACMAGRACAGAAR